jgi:(2Fe-2S) ferredoxin
LSYYVKHIFICTNQKEAGKTCCANKGGQPFFEHFKQKLNEHDLLGPGKIRVSKSGCLGRCGLGPCLVIYPEGVWYHYDTCEDIEKIIQQHILEGTIVSDLLL